LSNDLGLPSPVQQPAWCKFGVMKSEISEWAAVSMIGLRGVVTLSQTERNLPGPNSLNVTTPARLLIKLPNCHACPSH
jgi:hypothetical protein